LHAFAPCSDNPGAVLGETLCLGNLVLDTTTRRVQVDHADIVLSVPEITLLELLLRRQGHVVRRELLEEKLHYGHFRCGSEAVEALVYRMRCKLTDAAATPCVHTVKGIGYLLSGMQ